LEITVTPAGKLDADRVKRFASLGVHRLIVSRMAATEGDLLKLVDKMAEAAEQVRLPPLG
jgi:hypothetical protein